MGYFAVVLGADVATGLAKGLVGLLLVFVVVGAVLVAWRRVKARRSLALIPPVALAHGPEDPGRWTQERAAMLLACGNRLDYPPGDDEGKVAYAKRVFRVELPADCD